MKVFFFFQAEDGIRDVAVTGVQTCALPICLLANLLGLALGFVLSLLLIYVVNKQSFGWTIQFHPPVRLLAGALSLIWLATVAAGLYPARVASRLDPIEVIHL